MLHKNTEGKGFDVLQLGGVERCPPYSHDDVRRLQLVRRLGLCHSLFDGDKVADDEGDEVR